MTVSREIGALARILMVALLFGATAVRADDAPVGTYAVRGWDASQLQARDKPYRGTATLRKRGGALAYEGVMDGERYVGIGIYRPDTKTLALHFKEVRTGKAGVAHFRVSGSRLDGTWVWMGDPRGRTGREIWVKK